jgi:hypothetical protein
VRLETGHPFARFRLPCEHGCFVKSHEDGKIEVRDILPTPTTVEMKLSVSPSKAS